MNNVTCEEVLRRVRRILETPECGDIAKHAKRLMKKIDSFQKGFRLCLICGKYINKGDWKYHSKRHEACNGKTN